MNSQTAENLLIDFFEEEKSHSIKQFYENIITWGKSTDPEDIATDLPVKEEVTQGNTIKIQDVIVVNDADFEKMFRMKRGTFEALEKEMRSCEEDNGDNFKIDLLLSLYLLGSTQTFTEIGRIFGKEESEILDVCLQYYPIIIQLSKKYVCWPDQAELKTIEDCFQREYNFPGVVGVIGNLHIAVSIDESLDNASAHYNEDAGTYSIVLQAVCDNNLMFRDIFVGHPGSYSAKHILTQSVLYKRLTEESRLLRNKHLLGGTMHPQLQTLLTPYEIPSNSKATDRKAMFNALHSNVMQTIEKTFQLVEKRFPRITCLDMASPKFVTIAVGAICTLHNFVKSRNDDANFL